MGGQTTIDKYIESVPTEWKEGVIKLRTLFLQTEAVEDIKWGIPHYIINGKKIAAIAAFKTYFGIWFHQGVFLADEADILHNASEGKTKGLRQLRFYDSRELDEGMILTYIIEAIENQKQGKEIQVAKPKKVPFIIPKQLQVALTNDSDLKKAYQKFSPYKRKEFCEYIEEAKREATKISRLNKCIQMIHDNVGLNDKYR